MRILKLSITKQWIMTVLMLGEKFRAIIGVDSFEIT